MRNILLNESVLENITQRPLLYRMAFWYFLYFNKAIIPPTMFNFVGGDRFVDIGEGYFKYLKKLIHLKPDEAVLDIGCGIGRVAIPLTRYISNQGKYDGFDIVDLGIRWCRYKIGRQFPWFSFDHANIQNREYNPNGSVKAGKYIFPYPDNTYDAAFASSVFTHMLPDAVENYVEQIFRVLKPGGRALCTFFIIDDVSRKYMKTSSFPFLQFQGNTFYTMVDFNPENAIAFDLDDVTNFFSTRGFEIVEPVCFGSWSGREDYVVGGQDMIVVQKPLGGAL